MEKSYSEQNGEDYFSCHDVWMYVLLPPCYHPVEKEKYTIT